MLQVSSAVWNQVAQRGMKSPLGSALVTLGPADLRRVYEQERERLEAKGTDPQVAAAYLMVAPLILEREAVADFVAENPQYRAALPEVTSLAEALTLAGREYLLNRTQLKQLSRLLTQSASMT